jgi:predicted Zn finger-like uncharacterized protein
MAINTLCPNCKQTYLLDDALAGKRVRCKGCSEPFVVRAEVIEEVLPVEEEPARRRDREDARRPHRDDRRDDRDEGYRDRDDSDRSRPRRRRSSSGVPVWVWLAGGGGLLVLVVGVVLIILFTAGPLGNTVTKENYEKLRHGMTEAEVIAILGRPTETGDPNQAVRNSPFGQQFGNIFNVRILIWRRGRSQIMVGFTNNSATMLSATNLQ